MFAPTGINTDLFLSRGNQEICEAGTVRITLSAVEKSRLITQTCTRRRMQSISRAPPNGLASWKVTAIRTPLLRSVLVNCRRRSGNPRVDQARAVYCTTTHAPRQLELVVMISSRDEAHPRPA